MISRINKSRTPKTMSAANIAAGDLDVVDDDDEMSGWRRDRVIDDIERLNS
jgi:hypothetical protein